MHWPVFIRYISLPVSTSQIMSNNLLKITDTVEGESKVYQHKFNNLEQSLRDLSQGGLFQQIEAMVQEVRRLTQMNEKYEVRYFLLSVEIERRGRIIQDSVSEIEELRKKLMSKDVQHSKELERIREESNAQLRHVLCQEIDRLKSQFESERQKDSKRTHQLELDLGNKAEENASLTNKISQLLSQVNSMRLQADELKSELGNAQKYRDFELSRLRTENQQTLRDLENRSRAEIDALRSQLAQERGKDIDLAKRHLTEGFNNEIALKDSLIGNLKSSNNQASIKLQELEAEIDYLKSIVQSKDKELSEGRGMSCQLTQEYDRHIEQIMANHQAEVQQIIIDKEAEAHNRQAFEADKYQRELAEGASKRAQLEKHITSLTSELGREQLASQQAAKKVQEIQAELKKKEKQLQYEVTSVEETLTVTIEEKDNEITELLTQIQNLHEMYQNKVQLEVSRANSLATENEQLKKDNHTLQDLSTTRKKEIEEWCQKYTNYLTPDEAARLKDDIKRLRSAHMSQEDATLKQKLEVSKLIERVRTLEAELDNKDEDIRTLNDYLGHRNQAIIDLQGEKDEAHSKLRKFLSSKDSEDALRMVFQESELKHQQENAQLKSQRDIYRQRYEDSQTEIAKLNQKYLETLKKNEDHLSKMRNASQTTSHIVRASQHITKNVSEMSQ